MDFTICNSRQDERETNRSNSLNSDSLAIEIIKYSGTLQEYRKGLVAVGKKARDGSMRMKETEYWGFVAIVGKFSQIKVRAVLRRVGDGNITFWSVMPFSKLKGGQKLYTDRIEDDE